MPACHRCACTYAVGGSLATWSARRKASRRAAATACAAGARVGAARRGGMDEEGWTRGDGRRRGGGVAAAWRRVQSVAVGALWCWTARSQRGGGAHAADDDAGVEDCNLSCARARELRHSYRGPRLQRLLCWPRAALREQTRVVRRARRERLARQRHPPVSYTHLTLPTICSV
eukprot:4166899-Prymnesium_polylepis.1